MRRDRFHTPHTGPAVRGAALVVAVLGAAAALTGCAEGDSSGKVTLRLGYFPNLTHATAIVGIEQGIVARELGGGVRLTTKTFNAGPAAVEALFSGGLDAAYIGPNPTINAWAQSKGKAIKVVAGAASGGAALVVRADITTPEQLRGRKIATPQLGNTQDVALRYWLRQHGLSATKDGGGEVAVLPQENAVTVDAFASRAIDGAWVPEPYATRLTAVGGRVLVDERDLWPGGRFVVTNLVVSTRFLTRHRDAVKRLVTAGVETNRLINADPAGAQRALIAGIARLGGKPLDAGQVAGAWQRMTFLDDPLAESLRTSARHAREVGLLGAVDLAGIHDVRLLNEVLAQRGAAAVGA